MAFDFSKENVSRAINDAYYARKNWKTLFWQILVTAILTGIAAESWIWFGATFVGLLVVLRIPYLGALLCVLLGAAIGVAAGGLAGSMGGSACGWTVGILVGVVLTLANLSGRSA